jgi:hypothetical protein
MSRSEGEIIKDISALTDEQRQKVMILVAESSNSSASGGGHLETLFTELGIPLICYKQGAGYWSMPQVGQSVKVYSNGYEGRVYFEADSDDTMH